MGAAIGGERAVVDRCASVFPHETCRARTLCLWGVLCRFEALVPRGETVLDQRHDKLHAGADEALAAVEQAMGIPRTVAEQARFVGPGVPCGDAGEFYREAMRARVGIV